MTRQNNNRLWWSEIFGKLKIMLGSLCFVGGFIVGVAWAFNQTFIYGFATFGLFGLGIYSIIKGNQQVFHFERQSGYRVYSR